MESSVDQCRDIVLKVHARFEYVPDLERWQTLEYWIGRLDGNLRVGNWKGDCEDFALICRDECDVLFIPNRLVLCECPVSPIFPKGGYHLTTEHNGWLMDVNSELLISRDVAADRFGYRYIGMSGFNAGDPWHWIVNP